MSHALGNNLGMQKVIYLGTPRREPIHLPEGLRRV